MKFSNSYLLNYLPKAYTSECRGTHRVQRYNLGVGVSFLYIIKLFKLKENYNFNNRLFSYV